MTHEPQLGAPLDHKGVFPNRNVEGKPSDRRSLQIAKWLVPGRDILGLALGSKESDASALAVDEVQRELSTGEQTAAVPYRLIGFADHSLRAGLDEAGEEHSQIARDQVVLQQQQSR